MKRRKSRKNANGSSGRPKNKSVESVDRISVLPDSILCIILYSLPTQNAVATTVLSKRWKWVWTTVHNLDLCYDEDSMEKQDDMRFVEFVNRVLLLHDARPLNKFSLVWTPRCISSHASLWISTAIRRNVHDLFLRLENHVKTCSSRRSRGISPEPFVMPISVFSCDTLRFLELDGHISVSESVAVCLPKLETLKLVSVYFQSEEAFQKLIRGCPVLINLAMSFEFHQDDDFTYIISSTSLRRLEVYNYYSRGETVYISLELEAPSLEYLSLYGFIPIFHVQKSLSSLVEAKLEIGFCINYFSDVDKCNLVVEAVRVFHCAKTLIFSAEIIWALSRATISLSTEFKRLVKLEAVAYCFAWSSLRDFIQCSDNLQVLTIKQYPVELEENDHDHTSWTPPVQVPRCLSNSLKKVVLYGYNGREDGREMIRYMLKRGSALEVVEISCHTMDNANLKSKLVQEICEFSKKLSSEFPACEVKFARAEGKSKCNVKVL